MTELSTIELYGYRPHGVPRTMFSYRRLRRDIAANGIREPVVVATDGHYAVLEDGSKRLEVAWDLHIASLPVIINRRQFSARRKVKWPIGPGLAKLLAPPKRRKRRQETA